MAARKKQNHRKKTAPAQKSVPQTENLPQEHEAPPKKAPVRSRKKTAEAHGGMVHKSSLYMTAVLCLLFGTYLGTLLPAWRGFKDIASHIQQAPQQMFSPAGQSADGNGHLKGLEEAARKNPQDARAWTQLGNHYFDADKPREAIRAYEHALSIRGDNPDVLTDMGIMYRQLGEFERAAEIFAQAGNINPLHEQSRFNLGVVLFADLNRKDEAHKVWRALIDINPGVKTPDGVLLRTMLDELK